MPPRHRPFHPRQINNIRVNRSVQPDSALRTSVKARRDPQMINICYRRVAPNPCNNKIAVVSIHERPTFCSQNGKQEDLTSR